MIVCGYMSQLEKLVRKFTTNPTSVSYKDIHKILTHSNCLVIGAKGSHVKYKHARSTYDLVIPVHKNECKDFYKKQAAIFLKNIQS